MFKPFFVHQYHQSGKMPNRHPRGFTVFVSPDQHVKGNVLVHTAWCSPKDEFNKKKGREAAMNTWPVSMSPKAVPKHVSACMDTTFGTNQPTDEQDFYYLFKRML